MLKINSIKLIWVMIFLLLGCSSSPPEIIEPTVAPTEIGNLPQITNVALNRDQVPRYGSIEFSLEIKAEYENPYDAREVVLNGVFEAPDGSQMKVPGFWDGDRNWRIRFTPSLEGKWEYQLEISDANGTSLPAKGDFIVTESDLHGWLQVGNWVDPNYSTQYLTYHDGTAFYGVGHCDALNILNDGFDIESGVLLFDNMVAAGENYVVWWPGYSNSIITNRFDNYTVSNLTLIDMVVQDAQEKEIFLIFTVWDHPQLRDGNHTWGDGRWGAYNGFNKLVSVDEFFTDAEAWAWQENLYRYLIARWGYSPAIGMWQTVSEINGTNAYDQTNPWHAKINAYFVENDPYRHPTTASMSGDVDWPEGHRMMDIPQVHVYDLEEGPTAAAKTTASWTGLMWQTGKPNWIGEFGVQGNSEYPELFHNSIWAALGAGAAMTPAEWNSSGAWMQMTPEMYADQGRLAQFVADIPLAWWNPIALSIDSSDPEVRAWGVAGDEGGLFWVQDFSTEGLEINAVRDNQTVRNGVSLEVTGLPAGTWHITPYDTWKGFFLDTFAVSCGEGPACVIPLPDFRADMAFKLTR